MSQPKRPVGRPRKTPLPVVPIADPFGTYVVDSSQLYPAPAPAVLRPISQPAKKVVKMLHLSQGPRLNARTTPRIHRAVKVLVNRMNLDGAVYDGRVLTTEALVSCVLKAFLDLPYQSQLDLVEQTVPSLEQECRDAVAPEQVVARIQPAPVIAEPEPEPDVAEQDSRFSQPLAGTPVSHPALWVNLSEAADILGLSSQSVWRFGMEGRIRRWKFGSKKVKYYRPDCEDFLRSGRPK